LEGFDLQPHLVGEMLELRPLRADDWKMLFNVASDPLIWEQHPAKDRYKEETFREFFQEALESSGAFAVIDHKTKEIIGSTRYFGFDPAASEVEIGWTFLARAYWGGTYNGEMKQLMLDHAFKFVNNVVFLIGPDNRRSRRACEKIGAVLIGSRTKTLPNGQIRESVVYRITRPGPGPS